MALHLSRTLALKAALLTAFLLIFFNLIGLRLEIFDKSPINLSHTSIPLQWPKRTHTNHHHLQQQHAHSVTSTTTTRQTPTIESFDSNNNSSSQHNNNNSNNNNSASNTINSLHQNSFPLLNNISNINNINVNQTTILTSNAISDSLKSDLIISKSGDIKINNNKNHSEKKVVSHSSIDNTIVNSDKLNGSVLNNSSNNNNNNNNVSVLPTASSNQNIKKVTTIKKSKYQDFDQSQVPDDGIFNSIMKVFGINQCPQVPPDLIGPIEVDTSEEYLKNVESRLSSKIQRGGRYSPNECRARDRVAIIVPFRDRKQHLPILLKNLHPFLMKQQINYGIFLIEQSADGNFNRAKLFNVGYVEALKLDDWDCFIFHDVDLLPMDDRNLYNCPSMPRHMSVAVDTFGFKLPYSSIFGGVSSMTTKQFKAVNGFSNSFWGWGGEDDDLSRRLKHAGYHIARYPVNIARYTMLNHKKEKANPKRYEKLVTGANRFNSDGLNSLKYKVLDFQLKPLYTYFLVEITPENS